jgi:hypothetical protein
MAKVYFSPESLQLKSGEGQYGRSWRADHALISQSRFGPGSKTNSLSASENEKASDGELTFFTSVSPHDEKHHFLGIATSVLKVGDLLFRFTNSDITVIARPSDSKSGVDLVC